MIPGLVVPIPTETADGRSQKIPHIGWNGLILPEGRDSWDGTLLEGIAPGEAVYFVHSFMAAPTTADHRTADCVYGGRRVCAAIGRARVFGCQFHPEKSGEVGLKVLRRFLTT